ncbi:hypothetical protein AB4254_08705, partial [Vibrio breoganii]
PEVEPEAQITTTENSNNSDNTIDDALIFNKAIKKKIKAANKAKAKKQKPITANFTEDETMNDKEKDDLLNEVDNSTEGTTANEPTPEQTSGTSFPEAELEAALLLEMLNANKRIAMNLQQLQADDEDAYNKLIEEQVKAYKNELESSGQAPNSAHLSELSRLSFSESKEYQDATAKVTKLIDSIDVDKLFHTANIPAEDEQKLRGNEDFIAGIKFEVAHLALSGNPTKDLNEDSLEYAYKATGSFIKERSSELVAMLGSPQSKLLFASIGTLGAIAVASPLAAAVAIPRLISAAQENKNISEAVTRQVDKITTVADELGFNIRPGIKAASSALNFLGRTAKHPAFIAASVVLGLGGAGFAMSEGLFSEVASSTDNTTSLGGKVPDTLGETTPTTEDTNTATAQTPVEKPTVLEESAQTPVEKPAAFEESAQPPVEKPAALEEPAQKTAQEPQTTAEASTHDIVVESGDTAEELAEKYLQQWMQDNPGAVLNETPYTTIRAIVLDAGLEDAHSVKPGDTISFSKDLSKYVNGDFDSSQGYATQPKSITPIQEADNPIVVAGAEGHEPQDIVIAKHDYNAKLAAEEAERVAKKVRFDGVDRNQHR